MFKSLEICAGAGGQALGLEQAGFEHVALVEYEHEYCECLRQNRPEWNVICQDVHHFDGKPYRGKIDLLSGGVPCPPFSVAGKQLGNKDERDLFPEMLRLVDEIQPKVVMIENAVEASGAEDSIEMLRILVEGKRIKDISDLPLDLAV